MESPASAYWVNNVSELKKVTGKLSGTWFMEKYEDP